MVRSGKVLLVREKRSEGGAKMDIVPVPVLSGLVAPVFMTSRIKFRYWYSSCEELEPFASAPLDADMVVVDAVNNTKRRDGP